MPNFRERFRQQYDSIDGRMKSGDFAVLEEIAALEKEVQKIQDGLTRYDLELYGAKVQDLKETAWKHKKPAKFSFKTGLAKGKPSKGSLYGSRRVENIGAESTGAAQPKDRPSASISIFENKTQPNASITNMQNSTVVFKDVQGATYIDNVQNSHIFVRTQQCRVHNSKEVTMWLEKCSNPVLENCSSIHFKVPETARFEAFDFANQHSFDVQKILDWPSVQSLEEFNNLAINK